jgi:hypothetical protein
MAHMGAHRELDGTRVERSREPRAADAATNAGVLRDLHLELVRHRGKRLADVRGEGARRERFDTSFEARAALAPSHLDGDARSVDARTRQAAHPSRNRARARTQGQERVTPHAIAGGAHDIDEHRSAIGRTAADVA